MALSKVEVTTTRGDDGVTVVAVRGAIVTNLSGTDVAPVIKKLMEADERPLAILSLADVRYLDSYSFNWIIKLMKDVEKRGGAFAISDPNDDILELFELSSFAAAVPVYRTLSDAREALLTGEDTRRVRDS